MIASELNTGVVKGGEGGGGHLGRELQHRGGERGEGGGGTWVGSYSTGEVVGLCSQQDVPVTLLRFQSCWASFRQRQDGLCLCTPANTITHSILYAY